MYEFSWIWIGTIGLILAILAVSKWFDDETRVVWGLLSAIFWLVYALQAGRVTQFSGGEEFAESYLSMVIVGGIFGLVMLVFTFRGVIRLMRE